MSFSPHEAIAYTWNRQSYEERCRLAEEMKNGKSMDQLFKVWRVGTSYIATVIGNCGKTALDMSELTDLNRASS